MHTYICKHILTHIVCCQDKYFAMKYNNILHLLWSARRKKKIQVILQQVHQSQFLEWDLFARWDSNREEMDGIA